MPTLQQIFGANASQDANQIIISKADLDAFVPGFTPSATNSGDEVLAAVAYFVGQTANESARALNSTLRATCTYAGYDVVSRSGLSDGEYDRRDLFTLVWYTPQPAAPFSL